MKITKIQAREIFDSRGIPTLACELFLEDEISVLTSVPSGASTGTHEALELRDGGTRLGGKGVLKAIENIEKKIAPVLIGQELDPLIQDRQIIELDSTDRKEVLGANATLAVSMALYRALAVQEHIPLYEIIAGLIGEKSVSLPVPMFNLINGGSHAAGSNLSIQEFMVIPVAAQSFRHALESAAMLSLDLKQVLKEKGKFFATGDEGGIAAQFEDELEAINCLVEALLRFDAREGNVFALALDVAATQLYDPATKLYNWHGEKVTAEDLIIFYQELAKHYPLYSLEDGLGEDDWEGWIALTTALGETTQIVGDDLFVTNPLRIAKGIELHAANAAIIKPNQIGSIAETLQAIQLCKQYGLGTIISHRSGETDDSFIADLAVATSAGQIKTGGCSRGERMAKYNRLLHIEDILMGSLLNT